MEYSLDLLKRKEQTILSIECTAITHASDLLGPQLTALTRLDTRRATRGAPAPRVWPHPGWPNIVQFPRVVFFVF
jgi:hypothetical protein